MTANRKFGTNILYRAATGLERAMADVDFERVVDTYAEAIIDVWDPYAIALKNLPYLAWGMGVNFWVDGWSEQTKRAWVARQWEFQSKRGTLAGPKMSVAFAGYDVSPFGYSIRGATVPPMKVFSGASLTPAQREAWMEMLPQLRIWLFQEQGRAPFRKAFYGGNSSNRMHDGRFCLGGPADDDCSGYIIPSDAIQRMKRKARWIVNGVEQDAVCESIGSYWQLHLPSTKPYSVFSNRPIGARYFLPSDAWQRIVTIQPKAELPWRSITGPSLEPVNSSPTLVIENGTRGYSVFSDTPMSPAAYYVPSTAHLRIFNRYSVNMAGNIGPMPQRPAVQIMGTGRYGFPKYTAWLDASAAAKRSPLAAGEGTMFRRFWIPHDSRPLERVSEAVRASMRLADKVMLDVGPKLRFVAGGTPLLADIDQMIVGKP